MQERKGGEWEGGKNEGKDGETEEVERIGRE